VPGEIVGHQAHAIGHAAVLLADRGVLLAGDMLSSPASTSRTWHRPDIPGALEVVSAVPEKFFREIRERCRIGAVVFVAGVRPPTRGRRQGEEPR
jgi:glyoxylase-like metal-dependent hydrolase (beta-lactamase superfamily II)